VTEQYQIARGLQKALDEFLSEDIDRMGEDLEGIDPEDAEKLRRMGYLR
jgi:hypothetical protein